MLPYLLVFVALHAVSSQQLNRLYWHRKGLDAPVLVRSNRTEASIDPVMLVKLDSATWTKHYDPIAKQAYINVPVSMQVQNIGFALRNEESVKFATVTDISASVDPGSTYYALGFVWTQGEAVGYLRLGCNDTTGHRTGHVCKVDDLIRVLDNRQFAPLRRVLLKARVRILNSAPIAMEYRLQLLNSSRQELDDYSVSSRIDNINGDRMLHDCRQANWLLPWKSVRINNNRCSLMVYSRADREDKLRSKVQYFVEEPICYSGNGDEAILLQGDPSDQNRWNLTLRMLTADVEGRLLADVAVKLSKSVEQLSWMRLWRAQRLVSPLLDRSFRVGQLRLPSDAAAGGRGYGELEVHCKHEAACRSLAAKIQSNPTNFWRQIRWQTTYLAELPLTTRTDKHAVKQCFHTPDGPRFATLARIPRPGPIIASQPGAEEAMAWRQFCSNVRTKICRSLVVDYRRFVVVQQRKSASLNFDRPWTDYVKGFGDGNNFWIGLTALHLLTNNHAGKGANLRIDMTFWNGTRRFAEYAGFKVAGPEANFSMTYSTMIREKTNVPYDSLADGRGAGFSTYDRDHDRDPGSCSQTWGRGGWWFGACYKFYPNGLYPPGGRNTEWKYMKWVSDREIISLSAVKMMIQI